MLRKWGPVVIIALLLMVGFMTGLHEAVSLSNLIERRQQIDSFVEHRFALALLVYMVVYVILVAVSFPGGLALSVTSGLVFGWLVAGLATVTAATIGAIIIFVIARSSFGDIFEKRAGPFLSTMMEGFQKDAFQYLLTLRLVPAFPFWVVNIVPGLLNMKLAPYTLATFLGILPGTFAFTYLGAGLDTVIMAQGCVPGEPCSIDPGALVTPQMVLALVFLAVLSFLPFVIKRFRPADRSARSPDPVNQGTHRNVHGKNS